MKTIRPQSGPGASLLILVAVGILGVFFASGRPFSQPDSTPFQAKIKNDSSSTARNSLQLKPLQLEKCPAVAVGLLVDVSGSMVLPQEKLKELKKALRGISSYLADDALIALYTFSGRDNEKQNPPQELISFSKYRDISKFYITTVNSLTARGSTYTRDAFLFVTPKFLAAQKKYPQYKGFTMLLFTDGIPYIYPPKPSCDIKNPQSCFSPEQDPTTPPDIAQELKDNNVTIYTIAFNGDLDKSSSSKLETMLKKTASSSNHYYSAQKAGDLSGIFEDIGKKLCQ